MVDKLRLAPSRDLNSDCRGLEIILFAANNQMKNLMQFSMLNPGFFLSFNNRGSTDIIHYVELSCLGLPLMLALVSLLKMVL